MQAFTPEAFVGVDPPGHLTQWLRVQSVEHLSTITATSDEVCVLQDSQMLGHRRQGDIKGRRQLQNGFFFVRQAIKNGAARRVGNRSKDRVHGADIS